MTEVFCMDNVLVVWEFDNPHDNVISRFRQLLSNAEGEVTLLAYSVRDERPEEEQLRATVARAAPLGAEPQSILHTSAGSLETEVLRLIEEQPFDLVIKSHSPRESLFHAAVDANLLRKLHLPLLICANDKRKSQNTVLATVDVSGDDERQHRINCRVVRIAADYASMLQKKLHLVYVIPVNRANYELEISNPMALVRKHGEAASQRLQDLVTETGVESGGLHVSAGLPENEIKAVANEIGADLVVVGSVGRKGLKGLLLGNTAERVIGNLRRDLLVVRPD